MSSNTLLEIIATSPAAVEQTWTATLDATGFASVTLEDGSASGTVAANESCYYDLALAADLNEVGVWTLVGRYTNTSATPDDVFLSDPVSLTVSDDNIA